GEAARFTPRGGDYVDVIVAIVISCVGDHRSIGRKDRTTQGSEAGNQTLGVASFAADDPDVPTISESDLGLAKRGILKQERAGVRREHQSGLKKHEQACQQYSTHRSSKVVQ